MQDTLRCKIVWTCMHAVPNPVQIDICEMYGCIACQLPGHQLIRFWHSDIITWPAIQLLYVVGEREL